MGIKAVQTKYNKEFEEGNSTLILWDGKKEIDIMCEPDLEEKEGFVFVSLNKQRRYHGLNY